MMLTCPKRGCHGAACPRVAQCSDQGQTLTRWSRASQGGFAPQMFLGPAWPQEVGMLGLLRLEKGRLEGSSQSP